MLKRFWVPLQWIAAGLLALFLPFTSFPLVARLTGSSMVAPLSLLPLLVLLLVWLLPYLFRRGALPPQVGLLLGFVLVAIISSTAALFLPFPPFKDQSPLNNEIQAVATLGVGLCFYIVIAGWTNTPDRLTFLMRWINWSGVLVLAWSIFQSVVWYQNTHYPDWMWTFQGQLSTSLLLYGPRANGFAYEPSWLAHQLNMLYLPFWLASTVTGFTAHRLRLGWLHFEQILLVGGVGVLVLSVSRIGLLTFVLMLAYLILVLSLRLIRWLKGRLLSRLHAAPRQTMWVKRWFTAFSLVTLLVVAVLILFGAAYGLSKYDERMAKMFDFSILKEQSFLHYANQLVFAERLVYWEAGWNIFNDHPLLGVGLGNAGFYFPQKLSAFSWALNEIRTLVYQWTSLPNIKSLWIRLLAETGVVGFAFFTAWCYVLWKSARFLVAWKSCLFQTIGLAGSFALIGLLIEGFSLDTFALPYYWVSFGLVSAACWHAGRLLPASSAEAPASALEVPASALEVNASSLEVNASSLEVNASGLDEVSHS